MNHNFHTGLLVDDMVYFFPKFAYSKYDVTSEIFQTKYTLLLWDYQTQFKNDKFQFKLFYFRCEHL
jgi:hypothetical protein